MEGWRRRNGERRLSGGEEGKGEGRRRWDGGKRWSTCFADFSPRSTFKSAHSMRRQEFRQDVRLECETETGHRFIIGPFPRDLTRISHLNFPNYQRSSKWKWLSGRITKPRPRHAHNDTFLRSVGGVAYSWTTWTKPCSSLGKEEIFNRVARHRRQQTGGGKGLPVRNKNRNTKRSATSAVICWP